MAEENDSGNADGLMLADNLKRSLPANYGVEDSTVPESSESFDEIAGVKNRVNRACQNLTRVRPNDKVTRALCQIVIGELDRQLQSILSRQGILVTKLPRTEKLGWKVSKKLDMSLLKFPARPRKQPRITLNQAIYLVHGICPNLMKMGDEVIIDVCTKATELVRKWSLLRMARMRQNGHKGRHRIYIVNN